ncbi:MAG: glycosyltransferase [Alphaproteobacteria bacterium]
MRPRSVISLLVWDSPLYTRNLLKNLDWAVPGNSMHTIILDQGSEPETRDYLREYVPSRSNISAILLDENIGYGAGHNRNYQTARDQGEFDYFITINNDVVFGEQLWADRLVDMMEANPRAAIGGPFGYRRDGDYLTPSTKEDMKSGNFLFVTGAICIIRAAAVEQAGLFDEAYSPAYWEDYDMAMRYLHFGWEQIFIDISAVHGYFGNDEKVSRKKKEALLERHGNFEERNREIFNRRWIGIPPLSERENPLSWSDALYRPK